MQQNINQEQMKFGLVEGPSWEMSGLKKAGINPLLRYGSHGTPTGASAQGVSQATPINKLSELGAAIGDIGTSAADTYSKMASAKKTIRETDKIGEEMQNLLMQRDLTYAQIQSEAQKQWNLAADTLLKAAQENLTRLEYQKVVASIDNLDADTANKHLLGIMLDNGVTLSEIISSFLIDGASSSWSFAQWIASRPGADAIRQSLENGRLGNNAISAAMRRFLGLPDF